VERQQHGTVCGRALRKHHHRFAGFQQVTHALVQRADGVAPAALDVQRARHRHQAAHQRPAADLAFGDEACRQGGCHAEDVDPRDVIDEQQPAAFTGPHARRGKLVRQVTHHLDPHAADKHQRPRPPPHDAIAARRRPPGKHRRGDQQPDQQQHQHADQAQWRQHKTHRVDQAVASASLSNRTSPPTMVQRARPSSS